MKTKQGTNAGRSAWGQVDRVDDLREPFESVVQRRVPAFDQPVRAQHQRGPLGQGKRGIDKLDVTDTEWQPGVEAEVAGRLARSAEQRRQVPGGRDAQHRGRRVLDGVPAGGQRSGAQRMHDGVQPGQHRGGLVAFQRVRA